MLIRGGFLLLLICFFKILNFGNCVIVELPKLGYVQGKTIETAWTKREVFHFVDVKYGESTAGAKRFKPANPVIPWDGIYNATTKRIGCPSALSLKELESENATDIEDCLTMTITTPDIAGNFPVLVYIHGDYLYEGSNSEAPPDYLLEKDIVLVAPQYRLGPFGFLSTKTEEIPGNAGVMDVFLALNFVKIFISKFGGNPNNVTLAGQVGGAAIVHLLTLSPIVEPGLFHQVIYQSGSAMMGVFLDDEPRQYAEDIAIRAGCTEVNIMYDLNDCLLNLDALDLIASFTEHSAEGSINGTGKSGGSQFTIGGPSPVLPVHPSTLMMDQNTFKYPAMGGVPRNAGTMLLSEIFINDFAGKVPDDYYSAVDYVDHVMSQIIREDNDKLLSNFVIHDFFKPDQLENGTFQSLLTGLIDVAGTLLYKIPVLQALNMNGKHYPDQTFLYSFDYRGEFNRDPDLDEESNSQSPFKAGVTLTDEAIYLFPYPKHVKHLNPTDEIIAKQMVEFWTSFVIHGQPMVYRSGGHWPPMKKLYGPYIKIDETLLIGGDFAQEYRATTSDDARGIKLIREAYYRNKKKLLDYVK